MALLSQDNSISTTYVHTEGAVSLAYSPDARYLYSGGADGIRCFDLTQADDAKTIEYHKDPVTYLDCSTDHLASCSESGEAVLHDHSASPDHPSPFRCLITRTALPSRCVKFSPNHNKLAISSDELTIKIVDVQDPRNCQLLAGHSKSVKSLAWMPDSTILVSSACDGALRIWNVKPNSNEDSRCLQVIEDVVPKVLPESDQSIEPVWHPSGQYFVVPNRDRGLVIFTRTIPDTTWKRAKTVCQLGTSGEPLQGHKKPITALRFSQNGKYLATGCEDGLIIIWSTQSWKCEAHIQPESGSPITAIQWRPQANALVIANRQGQITTWLNVISPSQPPPFHESSFAAMDVDRDQDSVDLDDAADELEDNLDAYNGGAYEGDDWVIDDVNVGKQHPKPHAKKTGSKPSTHHLSSLRSSLHAQEPFQSGATSVGRGLDSDAELCRRYMAFNLIGLVEVIEKEDENIITVEFHDRGKRSGYHFTDSFKFNLSSIGDLGVGFACRTNKSKTIPSVIRYEPFESWATSGFASRESEQIRTDEDASWQFDLPRGESATCLACGGCASGDGELETHGLTGSGAVVVGTDKGYVRLFTGSGIQAYIWNLGQQIISLACSNEFVFVVHRSPISPRTHPLNYTVMDTTTFEVIQEGLIPLPNEQVLLTWIGFTQAHSIPACYTSAGILSFLDKARRPRQGRWVPVLDTTALRSEGQLDRAYWPVGISESELSCIILKGGETQPRFPTPLVQEVSLQMPVLRLDQPQGKLEESYLRGSMVHNHEEDCANPDDYVTASDLSSSRLELEKQLLNLVKTCCEAEPVPQLQKALDYAGWLKNKNTLEASMKICKHFNLAGLADRVSKVLEAKELQGDTDGLGKRASKYAHLEDYSILTESRPLGRRKSNKREDELFEKPFEEPSSRAYGRGGGLFSRGDVFTGPVPERRQVHEEMDEEDGWKEDGMEEHGDLNSAADMTTDSFMHGTEDVSDEHTFGSIKRPRLSEYHLGSTGTQRKESTNPFAKKAAPSAARIDQHSPASGGSNSSTNPFGVKQSTFKSADKKKADRFLDRAEEYNQGPKNGAGKGKTRQSTLFGLPGPKVTNAENNEGGGGAKKGKKRKNEASGKNDGEGEMKGGKVNQGKEIPITGFLAKPPLVSDEGQGAGKKQDSLTKVKDNTQNGGEESQVEQPESLRTEAGESQMSLASINFEESLPPRIRSTFPEPESVEDGEETVGSMKEKEIGMRMDKGKGKEINQDDENPKGKENVQTTRLEAFRAKVKS